MALNERKKNLKENDTCVVFTLTGAPSPPPLLLFLKSLTALSSFFRVSLFPLTLRLLFFIPLSAGASKIPQKPLSFDPSARFPPSIVLNLFKSRGNRNNLISLIDILILDFVFFYRNSCDSRSVWLLRN